MAVVTVQAIAKIKATLFVLILSILCISAHCKSNNFKVINIGLLDHNPNTFNEPRHFDKKEDATILSNLRNIYLEIIKSELKLKYPNSEINIKNFSNYVSDFRVFNLKSVINNAIQNNDIHLFFGGFNNDFFTYPQVKKAINEAGVAIIGFSSLSNLRSLKNYYTPYEWSDTMIKTALGAALTDLNKEKELRPAAVIINNPWSKIAFTNTQESFNDKIFYRRLIQVNPVLSYKDNLDAKVNDIISYKPSIIVNPNGTIISISVIIKLLKKGFNGIFLDNDTWGCGRTTERHQRTLFENTQNKAIGYSAFQNACYKDYLDDEKKFRQKVLDKDEYYYTNIGLFYKMTKHILESVLKSKLPVNRDNVHKIIKANSFFKGFSGNRYNLYKTKDSPEFLRVYKFYFQKDFFFENVTKELMNSKTKKKHLKRKLKKDRS